MPPGSNPDLLDPLKTEIEAFLLSHPHACLFEDGAKIADFSSSEWRLSLAFGKLLLEVWDGTRSMVRRVEEIACRDNGQLGLFVRKTGGRETAVLELRGPVADGHTPHAERAARAARAESRQGLRRDLAAYLNEHFPEWRLERVSNRSDREHSFSAWYTRGLARRGRAGWAFAALDPSESLAAADAALAYGLNWLDWLREHSGSCVVSGLKLFLPSAAIPLTALRAVHLNAAAARVEIFPWPHPGAPIPVSSGEFANAETRLSPRHDAGQWIERHSDLLLGAFGKSLGRMDAVPDSAANVLSLRVFGLEVARMEGRIAPQLVWGVEGNRRIYREEERQECQEFIDRVVEIRRPGGRKDDDFYRLQPERWLESLLLRDVSKLDPELTAGHAYPQVPAFSGVDRGVIDILSVTKQGRLAVIELKLHEEITLPLQGLDYWLRVKWLNDRGQFHSAGYFPGVPISPAPPMLYLVSPAFRFHPANERILRYFHPSVEVIEVGLNQQWREGVKVLFRKNVRRE